MRVNGGAGPTPPLTALEFHVLLVLAKKTLDGYAMLRGSRVNPEARQRYLFNAIAALVRRLGPPVVLLEDLHSADAATLAMVEHLAAQIAEAPPLVVGTYRDTEVEDHPGFGRLLESLLSKRLAERMPLARLERDDVAEMLRRIEETPSREPGSARRTRREHRLSG